mmetsp:Transcript_42895/g.84276  ORF Transcript_42895/g.84276 Transcript_42895/m.84276 type:complete len:322 (+) Transcript_42895:52-1017(+)
MRSAWPKRTTFQAAKNMRSISIAQPRSLPFAIVAFAVVTAVFAKILVIIFPRLLVTATEPIRSHRWIMDSARCNITRISYEKLLDLYGPSGLPPLHDEPVIIYEDTGLADDRSTRRRAFRDATSRANIERAFPENFEVMLTSSNAYSERRKKMTLAEYIESHVVSKTVTPGSMSNETWYLFGETHSDDWKALLKHYVLPPCKTCDVEGGTALSFGVGGIGSGVQWHVHGPGFSESIHGRKHWTLYPADWEVPGFHKDESSRSWMETVYMSMIAGARLDELPWECTVKEGEMIYFPHMWSHAIINLDPYTVFVSSFTTEHGF